MKVPKLVGNEFLVFEDLKVGNQKSHSSLPSTISGSDYPLIPIEGYKTSQTNGWLFFSSFDFYSDASVTSIQPPKQKYATCILSTSIPNISMFLLCQQREGTKRDPGGGRGRGLFVNNLQQMSFKSVLQTYDSCYTYPETEFRIQVPSVSAAIMAKKTDRI